MISAPLAHDAWLKRQRITRHQSPEMCFVCEDRACGRCIKRHGATTWLSGRREMINDATTGDKVWEMSILRIQCSVWLPRGKTPRMIVSKIKYVNHLPAHL